MPHRGRGSPGAGSSTGARRSHRFPEPSTGFIDGSQPHRDGAFSPAPQPPRREQESPVAMPGSPNHPPAQPQRALAALCPSSPLAALPPTLGLWAKREGEGDITTGAVSHPMSPWQPPLPRPCRMGGVGLLLCFSPRCYGGSWGCGAPIPTQPGVEQLAQGAIARQAPRGGRAKPLQPPGSPMVATC